MTDVVARYKLTFKDLASRSIGSVTAKAAKMAAGFLAVDAAVGLVVGGFQRAIEVSRIYEEGMVGVAKTTGLSGEALAGLKKELQDIAVDKTLDVTAEGLLELAQTAGQLGIEGSKNIGQFVKTLAQVESATDGRVAGEEGAQFLINVLRGSDEAIDKADELGSSLAVLGNKARTNEGAIAAVATEVGNAAAIYGSASSKVLALSASFAENKIQAEVARTTFAKTLGDISLAAAKGGAEFDKFGRVLGLTREQVQNLLDTDSVELFRRFIAGLDEAKQSGENLDVILNDLNISDIRRVGSLKKLSTEQERMTELINLSSGAYQNNTALQNEATAGADTLRGAWQRLNNQIDASLDQSGGEGFVAHLKDSVNSFSNILSGERTIFGGTNKPIAATKTMTQEMSGLFSRAFDDIGFMFGKNERSFSQMLSEMRSDTSFSSQVILGTWSAAMVAMPAPAQAAFAIILGIFESGLERIKSLIRSAIAEYNKLSLLPSISTPFGLQSAATQSAARSVVNQGGFGRSSGGNVEQVVTVRAAQGTEIVNASRGSRTNKRASTFGFSAGNGGIAR